MKIAQKDEVFAIETLKNVLHILHEKRFDDILTAVADTQIENPAQFLAEFVQGTLELNDFDTIDEYGTECSFKPNYEYSQTEMYAYDDGRGFLVEYEMTSASKLVDMVLQLEFLYESNGNLKSILKNIDPA